MYGFAQLLLNMFRNCEKITGDITINLVDSAIHRTLIFHDTRDIELAKDKK